MAQHTEMNTLSEILNKLKQNGVDNLLEMNEAKEMVSEQSGKIYTPEDLLIFYTFRFEGDTDPSDSSVLYLLEDKDGEMGYIIDAYGVYSNHDGAEFSDFIKKIKVEDRELQELFK